MWSLLSLGHCSSLQWTTVLCFCPHLTSAPSLSAPSLATRARRSPFPPFSQVPPCFSPSTIHTLASANTAAHLCCLSGHPPSICSKCFAHGPWEGSAGPHHRPFCHQTPGQMLAPRTPALLKPYASPHSCLSGGPSLQLPFLLQELWGVDGTAAMEPTGTLGKERALTVTFPLDLKTINSSPGIQECENRPGLYT